MTLFGKLILILSIFASSITNAGSCKDPVSFLELGNPAPCTGYLFSPEKEKELRFQALELPFYKNLTTLYKQETDILKQRIEIKDKQIELYEKRLDNKERSQILWFVLGVVVTGVAIQAYEASR